MQILPTFDIGQALGQGIGTGAVGALQQLTQRRQQIEEAERLRQALQNLTQEQIENPQMLYSALAERPDIAQAIEKGQIERGKVSSKQQEALLKQQKEQQESQILQKYARGEELTPEEYSQLSPTSLRSIVQREKPQFEAESEKLEAQEVAKTASEIEKDFEAAQSENMRLGRQLKLTEKGDLSTGVMVKLLQNIGVPLAVLSNPDTEEYSKLEADYLRDVRNVFPGGRITNYEIQAYLRTIPSLMNSQEGKKSIIRNRQLLNEAKLAKYNAYKEILKENKGKKPANLRLLINERISDNLNEIEDKFKKGIESEVEKFQQPVRMYAPDGRPVDIPPNEIENALNAGATFKR